MKVWTATDAGCVRGTNEDELFAGTVGDSAVLLAVADGMGGHEHGDLASKMAITFLQHGFGGDGDLRSQLYTAVLAAHAAILERSRCNVGPGMGTTLTSCVVDGEQAVLGHVGDSRAYLLRDGVISCLTDDHSLVGELQRAAGLSEREAMAHPKRNILTRALGVNAEVSVDMTCIDVVADDVLVLCTDGLTCVVASDELAELAAKSGDPARDLVEMARQRGGPDNVTVIVARLDRRQGTVEVMSE